MLQNQIHQKSVTAVEFFKDLHELHYQIQVSSELGGVLDLAEGFQQGIHLIKECSSQGKKLIFIGNGGVRELPVIRR